MVQYRGSAETWRNMVQYRGQLQNVKYNQHMSNFGDKLHPPQQHCAQEVGP